MVDDKQAQKELARGWARHFRRLGLTVLPSRGRSRIPIYEGYKQFYDGAPVDSWDFQPDRWNSTNFQVVTGTNHAGTANLAVVDLDGPEAQDVWGKILAANGADLDGTWVVDSGSGTGVHIYFTLPAGVAACQSGMLWGRWDTWGDDGKGKWEKHKEIRLFGDRALIVAPPSLHHKTGLPYAFRPGFGPHDHDLPREAPDWLLAMDRLTSPRVIQQKEKAPAPVAKVYRTGNWYRREHVLAAIMDKVSLAVEWGLKLAGKGQPNRDGWVYCYAPKAKRAEEGPSCTLHHRDGTFKDWQDGTSIGLFDLGTLLRPSLFPRWQDCRDWCGDRFLGRPVMPPGR